MQSEADHAAEPAWSHLHPAMLWFEAGRILRRLLVPLIVGGVAVSDIELLQGFDCRVDPDAGEIPDPTTPFD